jgi:hypothetical protein
MKVLDDEVGLGRGRDLRAGGNREEKDQKADEMSHADESSVSVSFILRSIVRFMNYSVLDTVVLNRDLPEHGLKRGDHGAIVEMYGAVGSEVEFVTVSGQASVVLTLSARTCIKLQAQWSEDLRSEPRVPVRRSSTIMCKRENTNRARSFEIDNMVREPPHRSSTGGQTLRNVWNGFPDRGHDAMKANASSTASRKSRPRSSRFSSYQLAASSSSTAASGSMWNRRLTVA